MYNYYTFSSSSSSSMNSKQTGGEVTVNNLMRQASRDDADAVTLPATPPSSKAHRGPFSYHFLGKEKEIVEARRIFVTILFQRTMLVVVSILLVFSVYWAAVQRLPARSLQGWIVDFDGEDVGQFVANALKATTSFGPTITWNVRDAAAEFPNGPDDLLQAVLNEACWVAVAINPGVSKSLNESLAGSGSSYNSSNAIAAYSLEGRNENAFRAVLRPTVTTALDSITHSYAVKRVSSLLTSNAPITNISPDILTRPVYFTFQNLRPFDVGVATAVTFIGLIYLLILSFIVVNSGIMARATSGLDDKLTTASLIRVRVISPLICYLPLTLAYSLLTLAFGFPFDRYFGRGGFMAFWMLSWFGMAAAGLALESMTTLLTGKYIQIFMVLWIIGNVAVCLWPIDALPVLYRYGYVSPFYNISRGVRAIAFGTKNDLGLNFGVLSVWIVISCISLPLVQWYRRREQVRAAEKRVVLPKSSV